MFVSSKFPPSLVKVKVNEQSELLTLIVWVVFEQLPSITTASDGTACVTFWVLLSFPTYENSKSIAMNTITHVWFVALSVQVQFPGFAGAGFGVVLGIGRTVEVDGATVEVVGATVVVGGVGAGVDGVVVGLVVGGGAVLVDTVVVSGDGSVLEGVEGKVVGTVEGGNVDGSVE